MIRQFDVFANPSRQGTEERPYVVVIQAAFLDSMPTRLCVPLVATRFLRPTPRLNPQLTVAGQMLYFHPAEIAPIPARLLRAAIANFEHERDRIVAAVDLVFTGV